MRLSIGMLIAVALAACLLGQVAPPAALAANPNVGYVDFGFGSAPGSDPTADKPQSKLWWNDGAWWAVMFNQAAGDWHIYQLSWPDQWIDTGILVDTRPTSRADALWDGAKLYIASLVRFSSSNQALLSRYSYSSASRTYTLDAPAITIMSGSAETLAIDKDTTGRLWIAYTQAQKVYVNNSDVTGLSWGAPFQLPGSSAVGSDDIASLVAYKDQHGPSIGVLWSSHSSASAASSMFFARHADSDAPGSWQPVEQIYGGVGSCLADDHINLKSLQADPSTGALFAAVKTSAGDSGCPANATDAILLVVRNPDNTWQSAVFGTVSNDHTRPLVLLDSTNNMVYMFATSPTSCGIIYMKSTSMDNLSFPPGKGEPFISSSTYTCINNATSTKQALSAATGLVVLASDESKKFYLHNVLALGSPPADTTPPVVTAKTPPASAANVAIATNVTATFSEPVAGVSGSSFTLRPAGGAAVAASVSYNMGTRTATLDPSVVLSFSTTYTAELNSPIVDSAGNPLATLSWSFTTAAPPPDTTPPAVISISPVDAATNVSATTAISARFSEPIDSATLTGASFTLTSANGAVAATITYDNATRTATLLPHAPLVDDTTYTARITSVSDMAGNDLANPASWTFTTAAGPLQHKLLFPAILR